MNDKFDELAKALAQSVTRRAALKKFGLGLAGIALATLGLASKAQAGKNTSTCFDACMTQCTHGGGDLKGCKVYCNHVCGGRGR